MVYEDTAERHRFDSFCKVVLRHAMLDCFREFSCQNKWLVSLKLFAAADCGRNLYDRSVPQRLHNLFSGWLYPANQQ